MSLGFIAYELTQFTILPADNEKKRSLERIVINFF
jgi:hypothetical protein